jgi:hypothetical protein
VPSKLLDTGLEHGRIVTMVSFRVDTDYDPRATLVEARSRYFRENGFGDDGGYADAWVDFKLGPLPFPIPNSPGRVRAVRYHDLHHVLTGYRTNFAGEVAISAWEIGAGCKGFVVAWQLNLSAMAGGILFMPRETLQAFARGRRSESLYGRDFEPLLGWTVAGAREAVHVPSDEVRTTFGDWVGFVLAVAAGWVVGLLSFAVFLLLLPIGLLATYAKNVSDRRR